MIWEDKEVEELGEMCREVKVKKCVINDRIDCKPKCTKKTRKECKTVNTKQCRRRPVQGRGKRRCVGRWVCDYQWEAEGEVEIMVKVPGSCKETKTGNCIQNLSEVCEDSPVNVCEYVDEEECGEEFTEQDCSGQPVLVCKVETEERCQDIIKRVKRKVSRREEKKICRPEKED